MARCQQKPRGAPGTAIASLENGASPAGFIGALHIEASGTRQVLERQGGAHDAVSGRGRRGRGRQRRAARASQSAPSGRSARLWATWWGQASALGQAPVAGLTVTPLVIPRRPRCR